MGVYDESVLSVVEILVLSLGASLGSVIIMTRWIRRAVAPISLMVTIGLHCLCVSGGLAVSIQTRIHPDAKYYPEFSTPGFSVSLPGNVLDIGEDFYATLSLTDSVTIGVDEGELHEMLGDIKDIEVDPQGRILVLDSEFSEVLIYNPDGSYVGSFGQAGAGPGELGSAGGLSLSNSGKFAIVFANSSTNVFERQENGQYMYRNRFRPKGAPGCAMNDHIYFLRFRSSGVIHKVTLDGELVASFGRSYDSGSLLVDSEIVSNSKLVCSEQHGMVAMVPDGIPILYGYAEDGTYLYRVNFVDIEPPPIVERGKGRSVTYKNWSAGQGILYRIFVDAFGDFNLAYVINADRGKETPWHYYRINAQNGQSRYLGNAPLIQAVDREFLVLSWAHPFPVLRIIRYEAQ